MAYKTTGEKKARKLLIEHLKTRRVNGARIAQGEKTAAELERLGLAPQVFLFKNLFSGQVLYSQVPAYHQDQIDAQFIRPNWENRKPSRRNDLWRVMAVAEFSLYEYAVAAYKGLVHLRHLRDVELQKEAKAMRKKNDEGNVWYLGQYRPTYSQEAVADLGHVIDEFGLSGSKIFWENVWRKGGDEHWSADVEHEVLPPLNPKHQSIFLDELRQKSVEAFRQPQPAAEVEAPAASAEVQAA